ncbi:hypothetical protein Fot_31244 [Forsythia ovata]|uniref:Uncharacterized protein n=1 Tax=Forsythia ovata TaxID=205694 RepID=A0ABD1T4E7_9LAMI
MENFEGRLLGVISKRLDHMEYKIDSLVELAVVGRFYSATSACDGPTSNTTNVQKAQPKLGAKKEAGLDDVMEGTEKERMLEDEAIEELVVGKQAGEDENVTDETEYVEK